MGRHQTREEVMEPSLESIDLDEPFRFACSSTVPCFNECCRDLNQFLTPYDILRLKNHFKMSSHDFLKQYCSRHTGPESGLPAVTLRPLSAPQLTCPFVTRAGCRVYENRPSSCRIYPLARAISRSRETGRVQEHFALLKEPHCLGHRQNRTGTVQEWVSDQQLDIYLRFNDMLMEIIALKNQAGGEPLDLKSQILFHNNC